VSLNRYAKQRDENEPEIVAALEAIGCTVHRLDQPCDLLVGRGAKNILLEVKNPLKPKGDQKLTDGQKKFEEGWRGQFAVVKTPEEAIDVVQRLTVKNAYP
jgi:hypothetical protein